MNAETNTTGDGIDFVRTPDDRFEHLVDFPYEPVYVDIDGLRMAYVDEGPSDGPAVLLLHGEPAWSYLYRRMIPPVVSAGYRCIAPDLIGFGRSDKPIDTAAYTYNGRVAWLHAFLDAIELPAASRLFAQDWGGLLGLRLVAERRGQFSWVAVGNTALPTGESPGPGFDAWLAFSQSEAFTDVAPCSAGPSSPANSPTQRSPPTARRSRTAGPWQARSPFLRSFRLRQRMVRSPKTLLRGVYSSSGTSRS